MPESKNTRSKSRSKSRVPLVVAAGVGLVVLLGIVAVVASSGSKKPAVTTASTTDTSEVEEIRPVTVSGSALPELTDPSNDAAVGQTAPTLTGATFAGKEVTIGAPGTPQLVFFVAHWCPHCRREVPLLSDWFQKEGLPQGIELRALSTGVNADAPNYPPSTWLAGAHWPVATMADDARQSGAQAYGLSGYPFFVAIDRNGKVVARASGELSLQQVQTLIAAAKA